MICSALLEIPRNVQGRPTLADAIPDTDVGDPERAELTAVYAEVVCAYARIVRPEFALLPEGSEVWPRVIDHLLERVRQARAGEISLDLPDIAEQLQARIEEVTARSSE